MKEEKIERTRHNSKGNVFVWESNFDAYSAPSYFRCDNQEDAEELIGLRKERYSWEVKKDYVIGTEEEYMKVLSDWKRLSKKAINDAYKNHAMKLVSKAEREIEIMEAVKNVCVKFDGKVLNKRFHDAVREATGGCSNDFDRYGFDIADYSVRECKYRPSISIRVDYLNGRTPDLEKMKKPAESWEWNTGDRLDAERAKDVLDLYIYYKKNTIKDLKASVKQYLTYLKKVREAEKKVKELEEYYYVMREWAKAHERLFISTSSIWN